MILHDFGVFPRALGFSSVYRVGKSAFKFVTQDIDPDTKYQQHEEELEVQKKCFDQGFGTSLEPTISSSRRPSNHSGIPMLVTELLAITRIHIQQSNGPEFPRDPRENVGQH